MINNIPIFRAKRLYSDEYVFGVPRQDSKDMYEMIINVVDDGVAGVIQRYIDPTTLSIHFPDMLDSQGNKIFASLQEDGKGGDMVDLPDYLKAEKDTERIAVVIMKSFNEYIAFCKNGAIYRSCHFVGNSKVIGIQE